MKAACEAVVCRRDFIQAAVERVIRRAPRGARSLSRPKDTLIYSEGGALIVETPTRRTALPMTGTWPVRLSIPTDRLSWGCAALKPGESLSLAFAPGMLVIDGGTRAVVANEITE